MDYDENATAMVEHVREVVREMKEKRRATT